MKKVLLALLVILILSKANAQVANYVFTASAGIFTPINSNEIFDLQDDDETTGSIPIGFNFIYNNVSYSSIIACSNGWISFNTALTSSEWSNTLTNSNLLRPSLYPLWDDLDGFWEGQNFYGTSGSAPNRVFTFEWRTFDWQVGSSDDVISFQVKLYESSNIIQFIYQRGATTPSFPSATIGIAGQTAGDYRVLNNATTSPTASSSTFTTNISDWPANGQVFQFAPPACSGTPTGGTTASTANPACYNTSITLSVTGSTFASGLTYQWQSSPDGTTWTNIGGATSTTYTTTITQSTWYRRTILCGASSSNSSNLQVVVNTVTTEASPTSVCVNSSSTLTASATAGTTTVFSENFNGAAAGWTTFNTSTGGTPANVAWTLRPDGYVNTGGTTVYTFHSNDNSQFYLTNADAGGSGTTTVSTILQSPSFSTVGYTSLSLQFYHHYKDFSLDPETAAVEVSTNGTTWTNVALYSNADIGTPSGFVLATINLNGYVGQATLYIRFKYDAEWSWWWAIDNVTVTGTPSAVTYSWIATPSVGAGLPASAGVASASNSAVVVTPTSLGNFTYTVTSSNSCLAPGNITVTSTTGALVSGTPPVTLCVSKTIVPGDNYFVDGGCLLFSRLVPQGVLPVSGSVNSCVTFDASVTFYNGQPYVARHYDLLPAINPTTSTGRLTLYATQAEFNAVNAADLALGDNWPDLPANPGDIIGIANLKVTQWNGSPTSSPSSPGNYTNTYAVMLNPVSVTWNSTDLRWEIVIDVAGFGGFYFHTGFGYPLPTLLISFNGHRNGFNNVLNWTIATEHNIAGYAVERSPDGQHFTQVGFVNSLIPGGTSNSSLTYHFIDQNVSGEKQYYRLKQTSITGQVKLSATILIRSPISPRLLITGVYPSPADHYINAMIELPEADLLKIDICDLNGRIVHGIVAKAKSGTQSIPVNLEKLIPGLYIIKISNSTGTQASTIKFVKK